MKGLKLCVVIVAEFISAAGDVLEDKKVNFKEIFGLIPQLMKVPKFINNLPIAIDEIKKGVSDEYLIEIKSAIKDSLDLENDDAEVIVEDVVAWLVYTFSLSLGIIKKVKKV